MLPKVKDIVNLEIEGASSKFCSLILLVVVFRWLSNECDEGILRGLNWIWTLKMNSGLNFNDFCLPRNI